MPNVILLIAYTLIGLLFACIFYTIKSEGGTKALDPDKKIDVVGCALIWPLTLLGFVGYILFQLGTKGSNWLYREIVKPKENV